MRRLHFPEPFRHRHPPVENVNKVIEASSTVGQRAADAVARTMGSWSFIILQSILLTSWVVLNVVAVIRHWDPYPFILMNLVLSLQAAYAAPIIMMSQNRQEAKDRIRSQHDYKVNLKAELEIRHLHEKVDHLLSHQWERLVQIQELQLELLSDLDSKK